MFRIILSLVASLTLVMPYGARAQTVAARDTHLLIMSSQSLTTNQAIAFEEFQNDGRYNGAFYISPDGGFSWRSNLNTLKAAKLLALQACNLNNRNCQIYATLGPKTARLTNHIEGLSRSNAERAENWLREKTAEGLSATVAANGYFGWGGWSGKNMDAARLNRFALNHCKDLQKERLDKLEHRQRDLLDREQLLECRIIISNQSR